MDCKDDTQIVGGWKEKLDIKQLQEAIDNNKLKDYLNYINVKKGDSIYIQAGTTHAILKNNLICEIQQNSDTTYRVYDWDRVDKNGIGRQLHKKEASETIKTEIIPEIKNTDNEEIYQNIAKNQYFEVYKINCKDNFVDFTDKESFYTITVVNGNGFIETENQKKEIKTGDSFIIPATLGKYKITGNIQALKSYIV